MPKDPEENRQTSRREPYNLRPRPLTPPRIRRALDPEKFPRVWEELDQLHHDNPGGIRRAGGSWTLHPSIDSCDANFEGEPPSSDTDSTLSGQTESPRSLSPASSLDIWGLTTATPPSEDSSNSEDPPSSEDSPSPVEPSSSQTLRELPSPEHLTNTGTANEESSSDSDSSGSATAKSEPLSQSTRDHRVITEDSPQPRSELTSNRHVTANNSLKPSSDLDNSRGNTDQNSRSLTASDRHNDANGRPFKPLIAVSSRVGITKGIRKPSTNPRKGFEDSRIPETPTRRRNLHSSRISGTPPSSQPRTVGRAYREPEYSLTPKSDTQQKTHQEAGAETREDRSC
ncbi:hypothetical protein V8F06_004433 [Rhypophila decipiens]